MKGHASEEMLEQYATRHLPEGQQAAVEEHLLVCGSCVGALEETEAYLEAMRSAAGALRRLEKPPRGWLRRIPILTPSPLWAAGVATVLLAFTAGIQWHATRYVPPPLSVSLEAARGPEVTQAPAGRPLVLHLDLIELPVCPAYRLEIVDAAGSRLAEFRVEPRGAHLHVPVALRLGEGAYFVRLYSPRQELLREYALRLS
ncbi:MAG TPA: hypothetical protein VFA33_14845 [Bryobacteraceae bacterium]|nr:hypothetical protein [Bryobacteraceae bacterium]